MSEVSGRTQVIGGALGAVCGTAVALAAAVQARALANALGLAPGRLAPGSLGGGSAPVPVTAAPAFLGDAVGLVVLALGSVVAAWFALTACGVLLCLVLRAVGRRWTRGEAAVRTAGAPLVRRLVGAAAGTALGTSLAFSGASAAPGDVPDDLGWAPPTAAPAPGAPDTVSGPATSAPVLSGWAAAVEPVATVEPAAGEPAVRGPAEPSPEAVTAGTHRHVVRPGESLWSIAAHALRAVGRDASNAAVVAAWPAWYRENEAVIGPDPDLIRPGQVLTTPQGLTAPEEGTLP
jgi:hypothetical protein